MRTKYIYLVALILEICKSLLGKFRKWKKRKDKAVQIIYQVVCTVPVLIYLILQAKNNGRPESSKMEKFIILPIP